MKLTAIKKITFIVVMMSLLISVESLQAYADGKKDMVDSYVVDYISKFDSTRKVNNKVMLYNENEEIAAILYQLLPEGYVVIDPATCRIIEYSWEVNYPYVERGKNYYNGPLQYYSKENELFRHRKTDTLVDLEYFKESRKNQELRTNNLSNMELRSLMSNYAHEYSFTTGLRTFYKNVDGRCGSVAASILFAYYDDEIDSDMVEDYLLSDPTGEIFSDYLKPHLEDLDGVRGSTTSELVSGMQWFIYDAWLFDTYEVYSAANGSPSTYVNCINFGRPVIIDLDAHPTYSEHWVVGYGYQYNTLSNENSMFALVNDGWGDNGIFINWYYIKDLVYLNKPD